MLGVDLDRLVAEHRRNARLAWCILGALVVLAGIEMALGDVLTAGLLIVVAVLAALPGPFYRSPTATLPWEILGVTLLVLGWLAFTPDQVLAEYFSFAVIALLITFELHLFTPVRMSHRFAVLYVMVSTTAMAGLWSLARWGVDLVFGIGVTPGHEGLMWEFVAATVVGVAAGVAFDRYVRSWKTRLDRLTPLVAEDER